jgi:short-subunit dehydrogenase
MDVMFWGTVHVTFAALAHMRARGSGRIVNITSIGGKVSVPHLLPYCSAKFAAVGFSEGLRAELAPSGITVTTVVPGLMRTGSHVQVTAHGQPEKEYAWFATGASLPFVAMDAERAAKRIVDATRRGIAELILTPQARLAVMVTGVSPRLASFVASGAGRLLPTAGNAQQHSAASEASGLTEKPVLRALTTLGRRASRRYNET